MRARKLIRDGAKLANNTALVTGGSRGIGAAIARRRDEDAAAVAITYAGRRDAAIEVAGAITRAGGRATAIQADAGDPVRTREAPREATDFLGPIASDDASYVTGATLDVDGGCSI